MEISPRKISQGSVNDLSERRAQRERLKTGRQRKSIGSSQRIASSHVSPRVPRTRFGSFEALVVFGLLTLMAHSNTGGHHSELHANGDQVPSQTKSKHVDVRKLEMRDPSRQSEDPLDMQLRDFEEDVTLLGIVGLAVDPPMAFEHAIAGWPVGKVDSSSLNYRTDGVQPKVTLLDMFGNIKSVYCPPTGEACVQSDHPVTATIFNNPGCSQLSGTTVVMSVDGWANFTDLQIDFPENYYQLKFTAGLATNPVTVIGDPFQVLAGQIYIPGDPYWNPTSQPDPNTCSLACPDDVVNGCEALIAGVPIRWVLDSTMQPQGGFEYPTVWVRSFFKADPTRGPEGDGWEDLISWDRDISVSMAAPGCEFRAGLDFPVCLQGLGGNQIVYGSEVSRNGGRAVFTDLRIFAARSTITLTFASYGMRGITKTLLVIPACADSLIVLQQPAPTIAGNPLNRMPVLNLVDEYNNSISEAGWILDMRAENRINSEQVANVDVRLCVIPGCRTTRPNPYAATVNGVINPVEETTDKVRDGIIRFTDLVIEESAAALTFIFTACFQSCTSAGRARPRVRSRTIEISASPLAQIMVTRHVRGVRWIEDDPNFVPRGATAGIPFTPQPQIEFQDKFQNVVSMEAGVSVELRDCASVACADDSPSNVNLLGNPVIRSRDGIADYTDLQVDKSGFYRLLFSSRTFRAFSDGFEVVSGLLTRLEWRQNVVNVGASLDNMDRPQLFDPQPY
eukprot:1316593-Rhodomonas_salina.1